MPVGWAAGETARVRRIQPPRFLRGLVLGLTLSFVNLAGAFLTITALGGLGEWTRAQFVGLFGLIELGMGLAFLFAPNAWQLPVLAAKPDRRGPVLTWERLRKVHWAGGVKAGAGAGFIAFAAYFEGVDGTAVLLPVAVVALGVAAVAASLLFARLGAARPEFDVIGLVVRRPGRRDAALPEISISASFVQLVLNCLAFPAVKLVEPGILYRPGLGPAGDALLTLLVVAAALSVLAAGAWAIRLPRGEVLAPAQPGAESGLPGGNG